MRKSSAQLPSHANTLKVASVTPLSEPLSEKLPPMKKTLLVRACALSCTLTSAFGCTHPCLLSTPADFHTLKAHKSPASWARDYSPLSAGRLT